MAMVGNPEILVLDEPTNGLDPDTIPVVREMIKYSAEKMNCAVLVSSHILSEIEAVCDSVYFIRDGQIISEKTIGSESRTVYSFSSDSPLHLAECLESKGFKATVCGDKVEAEMDQTQAAEFITVAVKENISIFGMDKKAPDLEQTYHRIMEGKDE